MANDSVTIYNHATGETVVREMSDFEQAERNASVAAAEAAIAANKAATEQTATAKVALLAKLGITADEFKTLLGGN